MWLQTKENWKEDKKKIIEAKKLFYANLVAFQNEF